MWEASNGDALTDYRGPQPQLRTYGDVGGGTPVFNSLQRPLQYNYHQPLANVAVDIGHNLTAKMGWNYYQYGEKSFVGPTDPRHFHANNAMVGLRWAF